MVKDLSRSDALASFTIKLQHDRYLEREHCTTLSKRFNKVYTKNLTLSNGHILIAIFVIEVLN